MLLGLRPLPAAARAVSRRCFSAAVDAVAPEVREKIAEHICRRRQRGADVNWSYLKERFNVSKEVAKQIEVQAAAAAKRSSPVSARITRLADDAYDAESGQRDWSTVTRKAELPLVECLGHFSAELSKHPVQPRPTVDDWSTKDILAVRDLLDGLPKVLRYDAWNLAGAYINALPGDCRDVFGLPHCRSPAPKVVAALKQHRDNGMTYGQLHKRFPIYTSERRLALPFHRETQKKAARGEKTWDTGTLAPKVREHISQAVREHYRPGNQKAVIQQLVRELPHIDPYRIDVAAAEAIKVERRAVKSNIDRLAKLVSTFGDDWDRAAATGNSDKDSGVSPGGSRGPARRWTNKDYSELLRLVASYGDEPVDWAARALADAVDAEVQRQLACGSGVDWEQVGQAAGLDVCMCLELCRIDEGKGRWVYDPDTFSWATAKRMEAFIADNYPLPAAPNFRAVSNYLWVDIDDCIRMVDVLRGKITMTAALRARVAEMRRSGMLLAEISKQLTPFPLKQDKIWGLVREDKTRRVPASPEIREWVVDFLDSNAEGCTYQELRQLAKVRFNGPDKSSALIKLQAKATYHRAYVARLEKADMAAVFEQVTLKKVTHQAMAAQLGVPSQSLAIQIEKHKSKMYSGTWTDAEVAQLMEFLDKTPTPHPWEYFAKKLGTKSKLQCSTKYKSLRKTGRVAR
ncbi:hypothetical protein IWQ57_000196 [Coemansia nantahalensis]|uniref:Uncharacterized protein n=1 Tax=Coemansia nantahalensis TaxID=2789366 RepID=A0ACC1K8R1_9FUNG|nr:hypothetical protein IWQ57_000196 [Coemansia nantahalensis]